MSSAGSRRRVVPAGVVSSKSGNHKNQEMVPLSDLQNSYIDDDDAMLDQHIGENNHDVGDNSSYEDIERADPDEGLSHVVVPTSQGRSSTKRGMMLCFVPLCLTMVGLGLWASQGTNRTNFNDTNTNPNDVNKNSSPPVLDPQYYDISTPSSKNNNNNDEKVNEVDSGITNNAPQQHDDYEAGHESTQEDFDEYSVPNKEREPDVSNSSSSQTGSNEVQQSFDTNDKTPVNEEMIEDIVDSLVDSPFEVEVLDDDVVDPIAGPPSVDQKSSNGSSNTETSSQSDNIDEDLFYKVVSTIPHNPDSFTQGLTYFNGLLYESTGLYGYSKVCHLDPSSGRELQCIQMESKFFGEGLAYVHDDENSGSDGDALVQLTWKSRQGFVYDPKSLDLLYRFTFNTETTQGWGITYIPNTKELVVSDGSEYLHYWNATDIRKPRDYFLETRERQAVTLDSTTNGVEKKSSVKSLNELEFIRGWIFANIWQEDLIMKIHPITGEVDEVWDMAQLYPIKTREPFADVLNGISIVQDGDELGVTVDGEPSGGSIEVFVTGKKWPTIYRIQLGKLKGLAPPEGKPSLDTSSASPVEITSVTDNEAIPKVEDHVEGEIKPNKENIPSDDNQNLDLGGKTLPSKTAPSESPQPLEMIECPAVGDCYEVLSTFDHDSSSFTQGLTYYNGTLYESTGLYGKSKVRRLDPKTGSVKATYDMDSKFFGEGMTYMKTKGGDEELVQITWKEQTGIVYDADTLNEKRRFPYDTHTTQGWGITYMANTNELVVSDGSQWLHFWNGTAGDEWVKHSYPELRRIEVKYPETDQIVEQINELEYMDSSGLILANIWYQNIIVAIDPSTGFVTKVYDFDQLWPMDMRPRSADCLNGISITDKPGELFVTGKKWPTIYRIKMLDNLS